MLLKHVVYIYKLFSENQESTKSLISILVPEPVRGYLRVRILLVWKRIHCFKSDVVLGSFYYVFKIFFLNFKNRNA